MGHKRRTKRTRERRVADATIEQVVEAYLAAQPARGRPEVRFGLELLTGYLNSGSSSAGS